ncbi:hypothetical protein EZV62_006107 [Acer yangbiense]|uniref:Cyclic nucleotide-binding domain-containing protein n=1 Tax=Acer yangbiense TaxID=1000413 RepID=A0A5C7IS43_9ROSI|nr:hypothetical protein EZV62_006107 [Acer yangbiense]
MQNLIKSAIDERTEEKRRKEHQEIKLRQQQLQQWILFGKLSENLQKIIKECQQYSCQQTGVVDVENLFINLPKDVENNIKRELCLEPIKKVERFRRLSDTSLLHLCDCVKPVVYAERTHIVREGDPINEMFVLHGMLWNFSSASSTNNVPPLDRRKEFLKDGDFWREELVNWVQDESSSSSSNKLISQTTIQALTKVEAFVLRVDVLKNLYNEKAKILQSWLRKDFFLVLIRISERNTHEKTPPSPGDQLTGPEIVV